MSAIYSGGELGSSAGDVRRFKWSAIWAGLAVALGCQLLLTAIGGAIGLIGTISATANEANTARGFGIGAGIWMVLSPLVSLFIGGFVASFLSGGVGRAHGILNGFTVWGLAMIAGALLVGSTAGATFGGLASGASSSLTAGTGTLFSNDSPSVADREQIRADVRRQRGEAQARYDANRDRANQAAKVGTGIAWATCLAMALGLFGAIVGGIVALPEYRQDFRSGRRMRTGTGVDTGVHRDVHTGSIVTPSDIDVHPDELH